MRTSVIQLPKPAPQRFKLTVLAISLAALTSCGGGNQDRGTAAQTTTAPSQTALKGLAIDGHLARQSVYRQRQ